MGQYTNKGLYNSYDKNHKERDKLDYYSTPPDEVTNILNTLGYDFSGQTILEPSCGGGHMLSAIQIYLVENNQKAEVIATDIHLHEQVTTIPVETGEKFDFLSDDYPYDTADWIIMNPPYATIEPFTIRALDIAKKGIIMIARLQFLEGAGRYTKIFEQNPPNDVYVYIDRIQCWKGGVKPTGSSAQAYAWFVWDFEKPNNGTEVHWIHRK